MFQAKLCSKKVYANLNFNEILAKLLYRLWKIFLISFVCVQKVDASHTYLDVCYTFWSFRLQNRAGKTKHGTSYLLLSFRSRDTGRPTGLACMLMIRWPFTARRPEIPIKWVSMVWPCNASSYTFIKWNLINMLCDKVFRLVVGLKFTYNSERSNLYIIRLYASKTHRQRKIFLISFLNVCVYVQEVDVSHTCLDVCATLCMCGALNQRSF